MRVAIGTDHRGFVLKEALLAHYGDQAPAHPEPVEGCTRELTLIDCGTHSPERTDYPPFAQTVCQKVLRGEVERGILLCASGGGMAIAANRFRGIYAIVAFSEQIARMAREDDHCNVLVLPADFVTVAQAVAYIDAWRAAAPREGRHADRLRMLDAPDFAKV